jgi:hypothetical protein
VHRTSIVRIGIQQLGGKQVFDAIAGMLNK